MATYVPPSLGSTPATSSPIYLGLRYQTAQELGKWRKIKNIDGGNEFILPPPKAGLGMATQSVALDEVSMWSANIPMAERARLVIGDTAYYAVSSALTAFSGGGSDIDYIAGGAKIPRDNAALVYKGLKKRAYNFSFQLFAYDQDDLTYIGGWIELMHSLCMPTSGSANGKTYLYAPAIFQPRIIDSNSNEVSGWLYQPQPCTMLTFNSSGGQYASAGPSGRPAVITVSMIMAEIESVINAGPGQVQQTWETFGDE
jgi:hypothetical protein